METLYFWLSGFLCGFFALLSFTNSLKLKRLSKKLKDTVSQLSEAQKELLLKKSKLRFADFRSEGWYKTSDPRTKWAVNFHLKEIGRSESNENLFKFEVVSVSSELPNDTFSTTTYIDMFNKKLSYGWLDISELGKNFNWIATQSKEEIRDEKLKDILGDI
jgi:hypothetical protein